MSDINKNINVNGNFKQKLKEFIDGLNNDKKAYEEFNNALKKNNLGSELNLSNQRLNQLANNFIKQGNSVKDSISKATKEIEKEQELTIDRLTQKYMKLGNNIGEAYSKAQKDSNKKWGDIGTTEKASTLDTMMKEFMGSKVGGMIASLGTIAGATKAAETGVKYLNTYADNNLNLMNKLTGNMASLEGISDTMSEIGQFEQIKSAMNVLAPDGEGQQYYEQATQVAKSTPYTEGDTGELSRFLLQSDVQFNSDDLKSLLDIASLRGDMPVEHLGLSIDDWLNGSDRSLKMVYGITNDKLYKYLNSLKGTEQYADVKGAMKESGNGYKIGDTQKAVSLLVSYANANFNGLTEAYANTWNGMMSRTEGILQIVKANLFGYDANTGKAKDTGAFKAIEDALEEFDKVIQSESVTEDLEQLSDVLGNVFGELSGAFKDVITDKDLMKDITNVLSDTGTVFADFIKSMKDSGELQSIIKQLPQTMKSTLEYEMKKLEVAEKMTEFIPVLNSGLDTLVNFMNGTEDLFNPIDNNINPTREANTYNKEQEKAGSNLREYSDAQLSRMLEQSNLSKTDQSSIRSLINTDSKDVYNIKVQLNNKGDIDYDALFNQLKKEISKAQSNQ